MNVDGLIDLSQPDGHLVVVISIARHHACVGGYVGGGLKLKDVVVDHLKVIDELDPEIAPPLYVVLDVDESVDFNVDCEAVRSELC